MSSDTESSLPRAGYLPVCYRCAPAHAPRPAGTGMRSQRAECCSAPPPGPPPPSRPPPVQRSAERLSFAPQRRSAYSERPGCGEAPGKRAREGRGGQGRAGVAHTHSVRNSYGGDKAHGMLAHGHTGAFRGASYGCELARGLAPGRVPFLSFFIPAARTRAEPEPDLPRTPAQPKRRALFSTC